MIIVIEDSDCAEAADIVAKTLSGIPHLFIQNETNIGQIASIDRAYAEVDTDYIFHCEEDWIFPDGLRLGDSRALLDALPDVSVVIGRQILNWGHKNFDQNGYDLRGIPYRLSRHDSTRYWGGFTFNPGLRRMSDYLEIGSYASIGPEFLVSQFFKRKGKFVAYFEDGKVQHIGKQTTFHKDEHDYHSNRRRDKSST